MHGLIVAQVACHVVVCRGRSEGVSSTITGAKLAVSVTVGGRSFSQRILFATWFCGQRGERTSLQSQHRGQPVCRLYSDVNVSRSVRVAFCLHRSQEKAHPSRCHQAQDVASNGASAACRAGRCFGPGKHLSAAARVAHTWWRGTGSVPVATGETARSVRVRSAGAAARTRRARSRSSGRCPPARPSSLGGRGRRASPTEVTPKGSTRAGCFRIIISLSRLSRVRPCRRLRHGCAGGGRLCDATTAGAHRSTLFPRGCETCPTGPCCTDLRSQLIPPRAATIPPCHRSAPQRQPPPRPTPSRQEEPASFPRSPSVRLSGPGRRRSGP